jgi:AraC-like DNA-binding protein
VLEVPTCIGIPARTPLHMDLVRSEPQGSLVVVRIDTGRMEYERGAVNERFLSGDVYVDAEPSLPAILRVLGFEAQTTVLDMAVLAQVAAASPTRAAGAIRLTSFRARSAVAALQWQRTVTFLRDVLENAETSAQPLVRGNAARMLAATVLTTFPTPPSSTRPRRIAVMRPAPRCGALSRSSNTIRHADISVADIAEAANVSIRAVQFAFRRQLDTTPMAYLRAVRLDRAHHDLLATDPSHGDTVTGIAARWGFYSNSRFAAQYRRAYGVTPRHTLHNG